MIRPREVHSQAVSGHFPIYFGLGVYGHGTCLHSLFIVSSVNSQKNSHGNAPHDYVENMFKQMLEERAEHGSQILKVMKGLNKCWYTLENDHVLYKEIG